jgi:hypothetical protein
VENRVKKFEKSKDLKKQTGNSFLFEGLRLEVSSLILRDTG